MLAQEIIRLKRDGQALPPAAIRAFMQGIASGDIGDAQIGAFAMAVYLQDMNVDERIALTTAIRDSGHVMRWEDAGLQGPLVDKHSTGGVGDLVSLVLGPWIAACGAHVPMVSGRGLGHTGGTLDKLESIPGYDVTPDDATFRRLVREVGVAIIGQTASLAPADKRLYAVRDVTATVESLPLIVASILGKKLACGLEALVMDVKVGSGAFMPTMEASRELAEAIVTIAGGAGTRTSALLTDMNQPLARSAGNALEIHQALALLTGDDRSSRLYRVTQALAVEMLLQSGLATTSQAAAARLARALDSGDAAERFARMVAGLGGPADLIERPESRLPAAETVLSVPAPHAGTVTAIDTRELGMAVVSLGGGRRNAGDTIDHSVGLSGIAELGQHVEAGEPLARIHARNTTEAEQTRQRVRQAFQLGDAITPPALIHAVIHEERSS
ncbi:thymidine phosphorylase [Halomonas shantousis]